MMEIKLKQCRRDENGVIGVTHSHNTGKGHSANDRLRVMWVVLNIHAT